MTIAHFSLSPALEREFAKNRVYAVFLDILEDIKHIFGLEAKDCTLPAETAHTFWNHVADIAVDIPYLFPNRGIFQLTRFVFLALAFWFVIGQPLAKGIANINAGQPLVPNIGPINLPVFLAPSTATLTPTITPSPTPTLTPSPTPTPTITPSPTATPIVFAREEECDPIPEELEDATMSFYLLTEYLKGLSSPERIDQSEGLFAGTEKDYNWWILTVYKKNRPAGIGSFALPREEWDGVLGLPSNRFCMVGEKDLWYPIPPVEDYFKLRD